VVTGLANYFTPFVGDAKSFPGPSNRCLCFIGLDLNLSKIFLHSWDFMRAEVGDEDPRSEGKPRLQHQCTRARQWVRRGLVETAMALLNPMDPLRQAWNVDIPGNFFTSIPTPEMRTSDMEVCSIMAIYMGIEDPFPGRPQEACVPG